MSYKEKLVTMLELQDKLNSKINPHWMDANFPWHRAIMVEGVEALEHYGWKWWKKQEPDLVQVRIELVDIWHFILSMRLQSCGGDIQRAANSLIDTIINCKDAVSRTQTTLFLFDTLIGTAAQGSVHGPAFCGLMDRLGLTWDELYRTYLAKNVLNMFRQANGYKEGTYVKIWEGQEDNVCLDILMKAKPDATADQLYMKLEQVYAAVLLQDMTTQS